MENVDRKLIAMVAELAAMESTGEGAERVKKAMGLITRTCWVNRYRGALQRLYEHRKDHCKDSSGRGAEIVSVFCLENIRGPPDSGYYAFICPWQFAAEYLF